MKKLIFVNCVLALAVIFTYCSKPDLKQELSNVDPEITVGDRAVCTLTNVGTTTAPITVCGTNTNLTACQGCVPFVTPAAPRGVVVSGPGGTLNLPLTTPINISISALAGPQSLWLNAGGNQLPLIQLAAGQCRSFTIDANCNITAL
jgi:hypothetical protein